MVESVSSWSRNGLRDFLLQRLSAVVIAAYIVMLVFYFACHPALQYYDWESLYTASWMRIFSVLTLLSLIIHAWIGMWTVLTDYIKWILLRGLVQAVILLILSICFIWGIMILWSV
jgi:succinate dehydrogenase / fumarate reductase membrane anchor subunit